MGGEMTRATFVAYTPLGYNRMLAELRQIAHESIPAGHSLVVTVEVDDGPTAKMRGKFHAMCGDIAEAMPPMYGEKRTLEDWKSVFIGAVEKQRWLVGLDGALVPSRKSSENMSRKKYCDLIMTAQVFGDEHSVQWSDRASEDAT